MKVTSVITERTTSGQVRVVIVYTHADGSTTCDHGDVFATERAARCAAAILAAKHKVAR